MVACGHVNEDELQCEEAVAHLVECCPGFDASKLACRRDEGCGVSAYPSLPAADAKCVRDSSCAELRAKDVCARAQAAPTRVYDAGLAPPAATAGVCP